MSESGNKRYRLVYYNLRGLAEPIRWMFAMKNVNFVDDRIEIDQWEELKGQFKRQLGQLPILYVDDNIELTQVHTCMRYVAKELGFNGKNEMETARADEAAELIYDLRLCAVDQKQCFTSQNPDIVRHTVFRDFRSETDMSKKVLLKKHLTNLFPLYFDKFVQMLDDSGGEYLAGKNMTYADLALANFLNVLEDNINPDILNEYPTLKALQEEVFDIPEIAKWVEQTKAKYATGA